MIRDYRNYIPALLKLLIVTAALVFSYLFGTMVILIILPFMVGWLMAALIEPLIKLLDRSLHIKRTWGSMISLILLILIILSIVATIGTLITIQLMVFYEDIPEYANILYDKGQAIIKEIEGYYHLIPPNIAQGILTALDSVIKEFSAFMRVFLTSIFNVLSFVPELVVFVVVAIISAYFIARDRDLIAQFILNQIPPSWFPKLTIIRTELLFAVGAYIKAQLILMIVTFIASIIGLLIIRMEFALLIALIASVLDALPIVGIGFVYVPMIIWQLIKGNYLVAISIGIIYIVVSILRRFFEPKILAAQIGFHPLSVLISMYIGLRLIGLIGMVLGPILLMILSTTQKIGLLPKWRSTTQSNAKDE